MQPDQRCKVTVHLPYILGTGQASVSHHAWPETLQPVHSDVLLIRVCVDILQVPSLAW